jgi:hypothetical protein
VSTDRRTASTRRWGLYWLKFLVPEMIALMSDPQAQVPGRRPGRPSKGDRKAIKIRVPVSLAARFARDAEARGKSQADTLAAILSEYYETQDRLGMSA